MTVRQRQTEDGILCLLVEFGVVGVLIGVVDDPSKGMSEPAPRLILC